MIAATFSAGASVENTDSIHTPPPSSSSHTQQLARNPSYFITPPRSQQSSKEFWSSKNQQVKSPIIAQLISNRAEIPRPLPPESPFSVEEQNSILSLNDGLSSLEEAKKYILIQNKLRLDLHQQGKTPEEIDCFLLATGFTKDEVFTMVSEPNGAQSLMAANQHLTNLFLLKQQLHQKIGVYGEQIESLFLTIAPAKETLPNLSLNQLQNTSAQTRKLFATIQASHTHFTPEEQNRILAHEGGLTSLQNATLYMLLLQHQVAIQKQQGHSQDKITDSLLPLSFTKNEVIRIVSQKNGWARLDAAQYYTQQLMTHRNKIHEQNELLLKQDAPLRAKLDGELVANAFNCGEVVQILSQEDGIQKLESARVYLFELQPKLANKIKHSLYPVPEFLKCLLPLIFSKNRVIQLSVNQMNSINDQISTLLHKVFIPDDRWNTEIARK